jgi:putative tricarboxylic transport membrane protein
MRAKEIFSILLLVLVASIFCRTSLKLGLGEARAPGPGFVPFLAGCLLIVLSVGTLFEKSKKKSPEDKASLSEGKRTRMALGILGLLFVYALVMNFLGFLTATFLVLTLLFKIPEKQSWGVSLGASVLTVLFTYVVFETFLQVTFPVGFLGF